MMRYDMVLFEMIPEPVPLRVIVMPIYALNFYSIIRPNKGPVNRSFIAGFKCTWGVIP